MQQTKQRSWLCRGVSILGILFGLLIEDEDVLGENAHDMWREAFLGFLFFLVSMFLIWVMKRLAAGVARFFARVAGRQAAVSARSNDWGDPFFEYGSWFFLSFGFGLAVSAAWHGVDRLWSGIVFFASGLGLFADIKLSKWLSKKFKPSE